MIKLKAIIILFLLFNFLGLTLHFFPNLKIPFHSDFTWFYRMQTTSDKDLANAIPVGMREIGAYPKNFSDACRDWWQYSGRFNCGDVFGQRLTAKIAGESADLWRVVDILFLSSTLSLFYFILRDLKVANMVAILVSLGLFFQSLGIWTDYKSSEPRAIFFLILGFLLVLKSNKVWASYLSALAILAASLTKETFVLAWVLMPALILWRGKKILPGELFPHFIALGLFVAFYLYLRLFYPVLTSGYVFGNPTTNNMSVSYFLLNIMRMAPVYFKDLWFLVIFSILLLIEFKFRFKEALFATFRIFLNKRLRFLIFFTVLSIFLAALPYFLTGREIVDRYQLPGNFYFALAVAILVTPIYRYAYKIGQAGHKLLILSLLMIFVFGQIRFILVRSSQNRIDQTAWQGLIDVVVRAAPVDGHVVLNFDDPYMVETAYSLEANTLFLGRRDLTYHLIVDNENNVAHESFVRTTVNLFNKDRDPVPDGGMGSILYVKADRRGGVDFKPYLNYQLSLNKPI